MSVTISDIAEKVGVTKATVSLVLGGKPSSIRISEKTRKKVMETADALHYSPSFHARALVKGRTFTLGLVIGEIQSPHYSELTSLALEESESRGYHMLVSVTQWSFEKELECLDMLLQHRVDGILFASAALRPGVRQYDYIKNQKYPVVLMGTSADFACVRPDWEPGMEQAVEYLQGKGHRRIGFLVGSDSEKVGDHKWIALEKNCLKRGLECTAFRRPPTIEAAMETGSRLARATDRPSVMIVQSDYMATGFIRGLYDQGIQVPRDIAVVGCDGTQAGEYYIPPLTTIAQDRRSQIRRAIDLILEIIDDRDVVRKNVLVPTELIVRSSA